MFELVEIGEGFIEKEKVYWRKIKLCDKVILVLFVIYGFRLNEFREFNIFFFNFLRGEFKIYRKCGKEVLMFINYICEYVIKDYL